MKCRGFALALLLSVMPVVAQDKAADKKNSSKKDTPTAKKYQTVGTIAGKLTKSSPDDQMVEIESRSSSGKYGRNQKQEYSLADDVKIRMLKLPDRLDEKNKPIPYTAAEKAKLKGDDPKVPGFATELSALKSGQLVELHLAVNKPVPGAKKKDKNAEPEKPFVTMIVIGGDAPKMPEKEKEKKKL